MPHGSHLALSSAGGAAGQALALPTATFLLDGTGRETLAILSAQSGARGEQPRPGLRCRRHSRRLWGIQASTEKIQPNVVSPGVHCGVA